MPSFDTPEPISATAHVEAGSIQFSAGDRLDTVVEVRPRDTVDELHERIKVEERRLLVGTVAALARQGATVSGREVTIP